MSSWANINDKHIHILKLLLWWNSFDMMILLNMNMMMIEIYIFPNAISEWLHCLFVLWIIFFSVLFVFLSLWKYDGKYYIFFWFANVGTLRRFWMLPKISWSPCWVSFIPLSFRFHWVVGPCSLLFNPNIK